MSSDQEQQSQQPTEPGSPEATHGNVSTIKTERSGPVLVVTIDRPRVRNAVDGPTADSLGRATRFVQASTSRLCRIKRGDCALLRMAMGRWASHTCFSASRSLLR